MALLIDRLPIELHGCEAVLKAQPRYLTLLDPAEASYDPRYLAVVRRKAGLATELPAGVEAGQPSDPRDRLVAPNRTDHHPRPWEGMLVKKPWEYRVTAALPHIDSPDLLRAVIETLRRQTVAPYILVLDTGSLVRHRDDLERLEQEATDVEIHWIRAKAWRFSSEPVSCAMDLAFARCQTDYLYATHTDAFLKRPDYLEWLLTQCNARTPAVGYQMSPRPMSRLDGWKTMLSHTGSVYHMPTMRLVGARWNMQFAHEALALPLRQTNECYPDTETGLGLSLQQAGIGARWPDDPEPRPGEPPSILMIGPEPNEPYETEWLVHERSTTCSRLYAHERANERANRLAEAVQESWARVRTWRPERKSPVIPEVTPELRARIEACPERGPCNCKSGASGTATCRAGRFGGTVSLLHCQECLAAQDDRRCPVGAEPPTHTLPPFTTQIRNFLGAAARFLKSGCRRVSTEVAERRLEICQGCEHLDKKRARCVQCGCWVPMKVWSAEEFCPLTKWLAVPPEHGQDDGTRLAN